MGGGGGGGGGVERLGTTLMSNFAIMQGWVRVMKNNGHKPLSWTVLRYLIPKAGLRYVFQLFGH